MSYRTLTTYVTVQDIAEDTLEVSTIERKGIFAGLRAVRVGVVGSTAPHDPKVSVDLHITPADARRVADALNSAADELLA